MAEAVGFPILLVLLVLVFGSFATAALPIVLGAVAVSITGGVVYMLAHVTEMSIFVTNVASMIGIGVSVDYSLFVLARYRQELRRGHSTSTALAVAVRSSGLAVVISGLTVMLSLSALLIVDVTMIRSLAIGAIVVVAVSVAGAVTLLPALIALLGRRIDAEPAKGRFVRLLPTARPGFWDRWTERVMRRPGVTIAVSAAALLALAAPALALVVNDGPLNPAAPRQRDPAGKRARCARRRSGCGDADPRPRTVPRRRAVRRPGRRDRPLRFGLRSPTRGSPRSPRPHAHATAARCSWTSSRGMRPSTRRRSHWSSRSGRPARASLPAWPRSRSAARPRSTRTSRTGCSTRLWTSLALMLALCFVVLAISLRSLVLPLKAVLMNLLTVGAAYGVLVIVFQWGWFDGLLGFQSLGFVHSMTLPLLLAVVFGLSMDYEVFLLSRIREGWLETGDNRQAVARGLSESAGTITAAALIMIVVFATFAAVGVPSIKELGVGLAVAIALDATLVRLMLVPATMQVLGRWNWWLPGRVAAAAPALENVGA